MNRRDIYPRFRAVQPFWIAFGDRVRAVRVARGRLQRECTNAMGLDESAMPEIEGGLRRLPLDRAVRLAEFLGVTLDDLARGTQSTEDHGDNSD